jgi:hypothetical protein
VDRHRREPRHRRDVPRYTRTNGIPWGPGAGHIERVGTGDLITTAGEFVLAGMLIAALGLL